VTTRRPTRALALLAALSLSACSKEATAFPPGVEPWDDPAAAPEEWPAWPATTGEVASVTGVRISSGDVPTYAWAHARVTVDAPIADVWDAVQWKEGAVLAVAPDTQVDCEPVLAPEPAYELSYGVKETPNANGALGRANWFLVHWRGQATRDATRAVTKVNLKAQKVDGTTFVHVMQDSVVATPAPGGGTRLEIVRHINAPDETQATAADWARLWVEALSAQLAGAPIFPLTRCFP
jgi:hypothetical protein